MKFVRLDNWATGLVIGGTDAQILEIGANIPALREKDAEAAESISRVLPADGSGSWVPMIENWEKVRGSFKKLADIAKQGGKNVVSLSLASVKLRPPLPSRHARIFALGGNNADHVKNIVKAITGETFPAEKFLQEKKDGIPPWGFQVLADTVVGQGAPITPPSGVQKFDYEGEIAVILKTGGHDAKAGDIGIWGYSAWNDYSVRDARFGIGPAIHRGGLNWALEKNFDSGNACGPWMVVDEGIDLGNLRSQTRVNGKTMQDWSTKDLIYGIDETAALISHYLTLKPGDMFATGTGPGTAAESGRDGDRWLKPGDRVEIEVEGAGILWNTITKW